MRDRLSDAVQGAVGSVRSAIEGQLAGLLAHWTSAQRLYTLEGDGPLRDLMVERFSLVETISQPYHLQLHTLSLHTGIRPHELLGQRITLHSTLAEGSKSARSGLVFEASEGGADGGLVRYRLRVQPWVALLGHTRHSRVWQDKSIVQILDDVLGAEAYRAHAAWQWGETADDGSTEDLSAFLARGPHGGVRPYCVQYRESDLAFLQRLLAEEGLGWRVEESSEAPSGHRLVFFADSARWPQNPTSQSSLGGAGLRFHRASSAEHQDAVQAFGGWRQLAPAATALLRWDYLDKRAVAVESVTPGEFASQTLHDTASWLQHYDPMGANADTAQCTASQLQHRATCHQQAHEARHKTWLARSTVRSLRAGQWFALTQSTLDTLADQQQDADRQFSVHTVHALGVNNLPKDLSQRLMQQPLHDPFAELEGEPVEEALLDTLEHDPELSTQAAELGYANRFEALRRLVPWRPVPPAAPTALGAQTAIVVGPEGNPVPEGADELYTDALGRVRVQFHWQSAPGADPRPDNRSTCWVRVAQRWAGAGMGQQHIPRIGQEVLLDFIEGDIERPIVLGSLYNGRGEAGLPPTPGGTAARADTDAYAQSHDHLPSAQGNLAGSGPGGHAPAWHGGAPGAASPGAPAQNNAAALSGIKSKEFGGAGFNQLVFDDTPGELRVQLATTQHATQLNLGHLIHQADNHRGSYRGRGFELRTDAYGAVRAKQGLLITTYGAREGDPAGDNTAGMALLKQASALAESFNKAAKTHQTTTLASDVGTLKAGQSQLSDELAPLKALHQAASGMVSEQALEPALADAASKNTRAQTGTLPHSTDPIVAISAKAGLATVAGQDLQWASGELISLQAGQDVHLASGAQMRVHTGQSLGILAGAVQPGQGAKGTGLTMIAGQGPVQMQAQAGRAELAAKGLVNVQTAHGHIDWASAKKITLTTSGGAQIVIEGSGITVQGPGKITVRAAAKSFMGGGEETYAIPRMPRSSFDYEPARFDIRLSDIPGELGVPLVHVDWEIVLIKAGAHYERTVLAGTTDAMGRLQLNAAQQQDIIKLCSQRPNDVWLSAHGDLRPLWMFREDPLWTDNRKAAEAMAVLDYSDYTHWGLGPGAATVDASLARLDTGRSAHALWEEIKKV
ncbi:MAG: type VI secretion system tip protein VgrG [Rhizobacter sp.]|nr:type VI secretion system tip protein VgrG [Rhizobacter sp.]